VRLWFDFVAETGAEERDLVQKVGSDAGEESHTGKWAESLQKMRALLPIIEKYGK